MLRNHRLLDLIRDNLDAPRRKVDVRAEGEEATIYLYDAIDPYWGISADVFVKALNAIAAPRIHLRMNSPGGDVFEARAIATAVRQHPSAIIAHVDGIVASAATWVATSAKEVEIAAGAFFMIHQSWALAIGNSEDMLAMAGLLEKVDQAIVDDYRKRTKKDTQQIADWMAAETWFNAEEAKEAGFADRVVAENENGGNHWNLSAYAKVPQALRDRKPPRAPQPAYDRATLDRRLAMFEKRIAA